MEKSGEQSVERQRSREDIGLSGLLTKLDWQTEHFPMGDTMGMAFCAAVKEMITEDRAFAETINAFIEDRPDITPSHQVNIMRHGVQKQLLRKIHDPKNPYPAAYADPEKWKGALAMIAAPYSAENEEFYFDIRYRTVQSNIAERYKAFALIGSLATARFDEPLSVLDIGCSQNQGLKKLALAHLGSSFGSIEVMRETKNNGDGLKIAADQTLSGLANELLRGNLPIGQSSGIDVMSADDHGNQEWAKACSFYPGELLDANRTGRVRPAGFCPSAER